MSNFRYAFLIFILFLAFSTEARPADDERWAYYLKLFGQKNSDKFLQDSVQTLAQIQPVSENHPQCRYPARYRLLKSRFNLAPPVECETWNRWKSEYGLNHISILYASQYLSNPASVFGHTFFLLGSSKTEKFAQTTFNYSAQINEDASAFSYASKGLTGGFDGTYSVLPFYHRLHIYSDMENRNLWEYKLNLSPDEIDLASAIMWELNDKITLKYYFLDENCASVLLWILKVVRPGIDISVSHPMYLAPSEIPFLLKREDLIDQTLFYPSLRQRLEYKLSHMSKSQLASYRKIMAQKSLDQTQPDALVLESLMDEISFEKYKSGDSKSPELQNFERSILIERSKLTEQTAFVFPEIENPNPPDQAHNPMQMKLGYIRAGDKDEFSFNFRVAIHGILDREAGYLKNSAIEILDTEIRSRGSENFFLEKINFFTISNFPSVGLRDWPLSWNYQIITERNQLSSKDNRYSTSMLAQMGLTRDLKTSVIAGYGLLTTEARIGQTKPMGHFDYGPTLGLLFGYGKWKSKLEGSYLFQLDDDQYPEFLRLSHEIRYELDCQISAFLNFFKTQSRNQKFSYDELQFKLAWHF